METVFQHIQPSEYYRRFLEYHIRPDGRHPGAIRDVRVIKGVLKGAAVGSAIVSAGHTRFLAGVTAEIAPPAPVSPKCGHISINVEFPRSCSADVRQESGGDASNLAAQASVLLGRIFSSPEVIDLTQFCITEGEAVWILYISVVCLEFDGNILDWSLSAVSAALEDTVLPAIEWNAKQQWWQIWSGDRTRDTNATRWKGRMVKLLSRPTSITMEKILDNYWLVDPTLDELQLGDTMTLWRSGSQSKLHLLRQGGSGLDVQRILHSLFEVSHTTMEAMELAISQAASDDGENLWETCYNDKEEGDQSN